MGRHQKHGLMDSKQSHRLFRRNCRQRKGNAGNSLPPKCVRWHWRLYDAGLAKRSGNDYYYKITAVGKPGFSTGLYMAIPGQPAQRICIASVCKPAYFISDTNDDFTLITESPYTFKITAPCAKTVNLTAGIGNDVWVSPAKQSENNSYFTIRSNPSLIETGYADLVKKVVFMCW